MVCIAQPAGDSPLISPETAQALASASAALTLRHASARRLGQLALASALRDHDQFAAGRAGAVLRSIGKSAPSPDSLGPTPQTAARAHPDQPCRPDRPGRCSDSVSRLERAATISRAQADAAREIGSIFEAVTRASAARIGKYEFSSRGDSGDMPLKVAALYSHVLRPWLCKLTQKQRSIVLAVAVDGLALDAIRRIQRTSYITAKNLLTDSLDAFIQQKRA